MATSLIGAKVSPTAAVKVVKTAKYATIDALPVSERPTEEAAPPPPAKAAAAAPKPQAVAAPPPSKAAVAVQKAAPGAKPQEDLEAFI